MDMPPLRPIPIRQVPLRRSSGSPLNSVLTKTMPRSGNGQETLNAIFDYLAFSTRSKPVNICLEDALTELLHAKTSVSFFPDHERQTFHSPTLNVTIPMTTSLVSLCYHSKEVLQVASPSTHASYDSTVDPDTPSLFTPIIDARGQIVCVIRSLATPGRSQFTTENQSDAEQFSRKMRNYVHLFLGGESGSSLRKLFLTLMEDTNARSGDVYIARAKKYQKFNFSSGEFSPVEHPGVAAGALETPVFIPDILRDKNYRESEDGRGRCSAVGVPVALGGAVGVFIFRGDLSDAALAKLAGRKDEMRLAFKEFNIGGNDGNDTAKTYRMFLEIFEAFNATLNSEMLVKSVVQKAAEVFGVEKAQMYILDRAQREIENQNHSRFKCDMGIAGHVITTEKEIVSDNIASLPFYHPAVDSNGLSDICCIPLMTEKRVVFGCLQLINRGRGFDDEELKLIRLFGVLIGVAFYNAIVYEASFDMSKRLAVKLPLQTDEEFETYVTTLVRQIIEIVHIDRCTIYRYNSEHNALRPWISVGGTVENPTIFVRDAITCLKGVLFNGDMISKFQQSWTQSVSNIRSVAESVSTSKISAALNGEIMNSFQPGGTSELNMCAFPLVSNEGQVMGALECASKTRVLPADMQLLDGFSFVVSELISNRVVKKKSSDEILRTFLKEEEDEAIIIPRTLMTCSVDSCLSDSFNYHLLDDQSMYSLLFSIINRFLSQSLERSALKNGTVMRYFIALSQAYSESRGLLFSRAVSRVQCVVNLLFGAKIERMYEQLELLALVIAALNYDLGRDSEVNNADETDMNVLASQMKWYSALACQRAIEIANEANLLGLFAAPTRERLWKLVCDFIVSLEDWNQCHLEGAFDPTIVSERMAVLKAILKCSQFGPLVLDTKLFRVEKLTMCEWFFRHGDYSKVKGIVFAGEPKDRAHINKAESVPAVLRDVALPMFAELGRVFGGLARHLANAKRNIDDLK